MIFTLTKEETDKAFADAAWLVERALARGAKVKNFRPHLTAVQLQAVDVASKMVVAKALGIEYVTRDWQSWDDPDLVLNGMTIDVKSTVYGNYLNVPKSQDPGKFDMYVFCHQLSPEPDISRWDLVGYCTGHTLKTEGKPMVFKAGQEPYWSLPVGRLRHVG